MDPVNQPQTSPSNIPQPQLPAQPPLGPQPKKKNVGLIIGIVVGVVLLLLLLAGVVFGMLNSADKAAKELAAKQKSVATNNTPTSTKSTTGCVTASDLKDYFSLSVTDNDVKTMSYLNGTSIFFEADSSTVYSYPDQTPAEYDKFAGFYKQYPTKDYTYHLKASTNETSTSAEGTKLANDRVTKAKSELVSRGVPAALIVIDAATQFSDSTGSARNVDMSIVAPSKCVTSN